MRRSWPAENSRPTVTAVVPARYHSTRLPGKPLADIHGKPMIAHVYERASTATSVDRVIVATDDARVVGAMTALSGEAVLTSPAHQTGTDRVAEVARSLACDLIVNVQGDEPLMTGAMIDAAVAACVADPSLPMATLRCRFAEDEDPTDPNLVKVVVDRAGRALYFSRALIPFRRGPASDCAGWFKHVGVYVYRREFLLTLASLAPTPLEQAESLEQLRVLEHGYSIGTVETAWDSTGVDTVEDLERARRHLAAPRHAADNYEYR
ncbi:MAG: 3-deoxy-manno-octulosonate cytidylyltransferase [Luteitalea sp.]|nr:3-deoxy-manno-octulosonate cytidylyltransferase [Luteitalea sp.]